jgi:hypothetical protein
MNWYQVSYNRPNGCYFRLIRADNAELAEQKLLEMLPEALRIKAKHIPQGTRTK